jgi:hypothetical protein
VDVFKLRCDEGEVAGSTAERDVIADQSPACPDSLDCLGHGLVNDVTEALGDVANLGGIPRQEELRGVLTPAQPWRTSYAGLPIAGQGET